MKQRKQSKVIAILALCISVLGLTLGFAAFSNTLTISSSATVTPDSKDFKLKLYGMEQKNDLDMDSTGVGNLAFYTSSTSAAPLLENDNSVLGNFAVIDNDTLTLKNISADFKTNGKSIEYILLLKNEGQYDAYINSKSFTQPSHTCEAASGTTASLVEEACKGMSYDMNIGHPIKSGNDDDIDWNVMNYFDENGNLEIPVGGYVYLFVRLHYAHTAGLADGDFTVTWDDVKINFSTVSE